MYTEKRRAGELPSSFLSAPARMQYAVFEVSRCYLFLMCAVKYYKGKKTAKTSSIKCVSVRFVYLFREILRTSPISEELIARVALFYRVAGFLKAGPQSNFDLSVRRFRNCNERRPFATGRK